MEARNTKQWVRLVAAGDVTEGDVQRCDVGKSCIALFNLGGRFYATSDICTHAYAHLSDGYLDGETIECPLHQGLFHIPTGRAMAPPVTENLRTYPVRVEDGEVYVEIDAEEN